MKNFCVIIAAIKKNVAFADDLVKKLDGISLVQRAIDKAKLLTNSANIYIVTDSEEISLISERNGINYCYEKSLKLDWQILFENLKLFILKISKKYNAIIILSAYAPLVPANDVKKAYQTFMESGCQALVTIKQEVRQIFKVKGINILNFISNTNNEKFFVEAKAFFIINSKYICDFNGYDLTICPYILNDNKGIEIGNYTDWWICEKLLRRRRIIFRVIGDREVGMGHIFRALALAHEITDHEILFVCEESSSIAVNIIAGYDYLVEVFSKNEIEDRIVELQPDLVVNDILNTDAAYLRKLKEHDIKVVNFEDLGSGASFADLTFNELYDTPLIRGKSIHWGHQHYFLRDEFTSATPHKFSKDVTGLLITFGGTDQNNYTMSTLQAVIDICGHAGISIYIVVGSGYPYAADLNQYLEELDYKNIEFTSATGVISMIMEKTQLAITSNGRTVYELAHMNIPSIVIAQHDRENTHSFACKNHGFVNLGLYEAGITENHLREHLHLMIKDGDYRRTLFDGVKRFNFSGNKYKVLRSILRLLESNSNDR